MLERSKPLGLLQRIYRIFWHSRKLVLYRSRGKVTEGSVETFTNSTAHDLFRFIPECCRFCEFAYSWADESKDTNADTIPYKWVPISLPDIRKLYMQETGRKTLKGLKYQAFYNESENVLIIAFRGSTKSLGDWITNLRWVTRHFSPFDDHYHILLDQVKTLLDQSLSAVQKENQCSLRIITTGHSLGGGLATLAAYASDKINEVVAINSSPVTGFFDIPVGKRARTKKGIVIARVFEHGEILAFFRLPLRTLLPLSNNNPEIVEARFNFGVRKSALTEHSLPRFSDALWRATRKTKNQNYFEAISAQPMRPNDEV